MTEGRNTREGEGEERIVDIVVCRESLGDQQQYSVVGTEESSKKSPGTGRSPGCPIRAVVVLLGLLSVVLLAGLLGLAVKYKTVVEKIVGLSMDRDMEQLLRRLKNLTEQRDALLCQQDCPSGWNKFGCKCYMLYNERLSWNKSREVCVSHGADLVVVDSKEEMDFISRYGVNIWLGATDEAAEGTWRWVDGTVLSLDNPSWRGGGPDGGEDRNCLKRFWDHNQLKWTDESCRGTNRGLCEHSLIK